MPFKKQMLLFLKVEGESRAGRLCECRPASLCCAHLPECSSSSGSMQGRLHGARGSPGISQPSPHLGLGRMQAGFCLGVSLSGPKSAQGLAGEQLAMRESGKLCSGRKVCIWVSTLPPPWPTKWAAG